MNDHERSSGNIAYFTEFSLVRQRGPFSSSLPFPSIPLEVGSSSLSLRSSPLNPAEGSLECCKLPQRGPKPAGEAYSTSKTPQLD